MSRVFIKSCGVRNPVEMSPGRISARRVLPPPWDEPSGAIAQFDDPVLLFILVVLVHTIA